MPRFVVALTVAALLCAVPAVAHHSYGEYDQDHPISVEGTIQQVIVGNPHALLRVRTDKNVVYTAEWGNALQLRRWGLKPGTLRAGDRVVITGSPLRDRSFRTIALLTEIRRPADGWRWSRDLPPSAPSTMAH
jgi:hypothetical protein